MNLRKKLFALAVLLLAIGLAGYFALASRGEVLEDGSIELLPATTINNPNNAGTKSTGTVAPLPRGKVVKFDKRLMGVLQVGGWPTSGTLDVYFQSSADGGQVWQDFAHIQVTSGGTFYVPITLYSDSFPTTVPTNNDGTLGLNAISPQSGIGERLRVKYNATFNGGSNNAWAFHVVVKPD